MIFTALGIITIVGGVAFGLLRGGRVAQNMSVSVAGASINLSKVGIDTLLGTPVPGTLVLNIRNQESQALRITSMMLEVYLGNTLISYINQGQLTIPARSHSNYALAASYKLSSVVSLALEAKTKGLNSLGNVRVKGLIQVGSLRVPVDTTTRMDIL